MPALTAGCAEDPEIRYVALGDSFTAAPLVPGTNLVDGCLQSDHNYPHLIAAGLGNVDLVDVSCSGASTFAMTGTQTTSGGAVHPAQFDALTQDVDLVTLSIGGNDEGLYRSLVHECPALAASDPAGSPCRDRERAGGGYTLADRLSVLPDRVAAAVTGIRDRSPQARILVVGYPRLLPDLGSCPDLFPLATGDVAYVRDMTERLTGAMRAGAEAAGAEYVDVWAASAGHDICAFAPWVNGRVTDQRTALAYHPFASEQVAVADLVLDLL